MPQRVLADARIFVDTGLRIETVFAGSYLAATHQFAALGQPKLAATAAQHGASEAQHLTQIAHIAGLQANDLSLPAPLFYQISDAMHALAPFIKGGAGFGERCAAPRQVNIKRCWAMPRPNGGKRLSRPMGWIGSLHRRREFKATFYALRFTPQRA
jgi:hypothetical protein